MKERPIKIVEHVPKETYDEWCLDIIRPIFGVDSVMARLEEDKVRAILVWVKENKPEWAGEIFCEKCPEHLEEKS